MDLTEEVVVTVSANGIATVTIARQPVNALTVSICQAIRTAFYRIATENDTKCTILTGAGTQAFCAGLDFKEFLEEADIESELKAAALRDLYASVHSCPVPVIAAVNGPALGAGAILAAVCDIRIAFARASFGLPEINVGRIGGAAYLGRVVPQSTLRRLVFTGERISSSEAYRIGLVDEMSPDDALSAARRTADGIAAKGKLALRYAKRALNHVEGLPFEEGYRFEQQLSREFRATHDANEAARAWLEKRTPIFKGR